MRITITKTLIFMDQEVKDQLRKAMNETYVELDFSGIESIDSTGLDMILRMYRTVTSHGGRVKALNVSPTLKDLFDICGASFIFEV